MKLIFKLFVGKPNVMFYHKKIFFSHKKLSELTNPIAIYMTDIFTILKLAELDLSYVKFYDFILFKQKSF